MMKQVRPEEPEILKAKGQEWGERFKRNRDGNPAHKFNWPTFNRKKLNTVLKEPLIEMTKNHCSYCDGYPLGKTGRQTIEHFKPKSDFPLLAFKWDNLFLCCDVCQGEKGEDFDELLLKPDVEDYDFYRYFMIDFKTGEILSNPRASEEDQERAEKAIKLLGLNKNSRPGFRLSEYRLFQKLKNDSYEIEDFSYRFMFM